MSFVIILLQLINKLPTFEGFIFGFYSCLFCVKTISAAILTRFIRCRNAGSLWTWTKSTTYSLNLPLTGWVFCSSTWKVSLLINNQSIMHEVLVVNNPTKAKVSLWKLIYCVLWQKKYQTTIVPPSILCIVNRNIAAVKRIWVYFDGDSFILFIQCSVGYGEPPVVEGRGVPTEEQNPYFPLKFTKRHEILKR